MLQPHPFGVFPDDKSPATPGLCTSFLLIAQLLNFVLFHLLDGSPCPFIFPVFSNNRCAGYRSPSLVFLGCC